MSRSGVMLIVLMVLMVNGSFMMLSRSNLRRMMSSSVMMLVVVLVMRNRQRDGRRVNHDVHIQLAVRADNASLIDSANIDRARVSDLGKSLGDHLQLISLHDAQAGAGGLEALVNTLNRDFLHH